MILNKTKIGTILLVVALLFSACDIFNNNIEPQAEFFKILQDEDFNSKNYPVDIKQTQDDSYIILSSFFNDSSAYVWHTPQITKTDNAGNIIWQVEIESPYVNPAGEILIINNNFYFVCMHEITLTSELFQINIDDGTTENVATFDDLLYPTYAYVTSDNNILVQGYNHFDRKTIFAQISSSFDVNWQNEYLLAEDAEEMLIAHITKSGKQFPFKIGELSDGNYFINAFYNYTFSTLFINQNSGEIAGILNGFRYQGAVSSLLEISSNTFALSIYNQGNNYIFPTQEISTTATSSIEGLSGIYLPELQKDARVTCGFFTTPENDLIVFASSTKSNEIVLYFYNKTSGELLYTKNISDTNPIEVLNLIITNDNNIMLIGRTYVNGSFSRVFVAKKQLLNEE